MVTARSTPNIALIKYWGNRNAELRIPAADSLSMTLSNPTVDISVEPHDQWHIDSYDADGKPKVLREKDTQRFQKHLELCRHYLATLDQPDVLPQAVSLTIRSHIPPAIGLASSAAVFSCVATAYAGLIKEHIELTSEQISILARLGSGSACRGVFGGYSAMHVENDSIDGAYAVQIAPEDYWILYDIIIAPSMNEKQYGSTEGHTFAPSSPLFAGRVASIPHRQEECIDAIQQQDFEKLQIIAEEDCLNMHDVMRTSTPSLNYLTPDTNRIVDEINELRRTQHLPVLYTMDAGATVHLICTQEAVEAIRGYAKQQTNCTIFEAQAGTGASLL